MKDRRDTFYGHKIGLTTGASGLVLDAVVEMGNRGRGDRGSAHLREADLPQGFTLAYAP